MKAVITLDLLETDNSAKVSLTTEKLTELEIPHRKIEVSLFPEGVLEVAESVVGKNPQMILNTRHSSRLQDKGELLQETAMAKKASIKGTN